MKHGWRVVVSVGAACALAATGVRADTLVLRDGRRLDGTLVGVRDGIIDFDGRGRFGGRERVRVRRDDVLRIELDEDAVGNDRDGDRDDDRRDGRRPSGLRERDVTVEARNAWRDTGIDLRAGQTVYFSARGKVRWGPGRQDGPAGEGKSPYNASRPIPGRPAAALIGRIGERDEPFFIGADEGPVRVRASGRLFLGINDDYLRDNSGSLRVTVYF